MGSFTYDEAELGVLHCDHILNSTVFKTLSIVQVAHRAVELRCHIWVTIVTAVIIFSVSGDLIPALAAHLLDGMVSRN